MEPGFTKIDAGCKRTLRLHGVAHTGLSRIAGHDEIRTGHVAHLEIGVIATDHFCALAAVSLVVLRLLAVLSGLAVGKLGGVQCSGSVPRLR